MQSKKSQGLPLNIIIIATILLIVLIVVIVIFTKGAERSVGDLQSCYVRGGDCPFDKGKTADCVGGVKIDAKCPEDKAQICCIKNILD